MGQVGDFAGDPKERKALLEKIAGATVELGDAENFGRHGAVFRQKRF